MRERRGGGARGAVLLALVVALVASVGTTRPASAAPPHVGAANAAATPGAADPSDLTDPTTYPERGFHDVKGLQPDLWPNPAELAPGLGIVAVNLVWAHWEPTPHPAPCATDQVTYDERCFAVPAVVEEQVRAYTDLGVAVTGIVYGTPAWARGVRPCVPIRPGFELFCVPDDPADAARFAGAVASHFDGTGGHGRVVDFVIQNEVNLNEWFNVGCGAGTPCDLDSWIADYAAIYNASYDAVRSAQPAAKVLVPLTHHFAPTFDRLDLEHPIMSITTFVQRLAPRLGERAWAIALHPYPNNLDARIDATDLPWATLGTIGVVPGWLRAEFPDDPHAWEVQLTEVGLHNTGDHDAAQADSLCDAFRNVLGTPGVTSFIYHRLRDHPDEQGLALGLWHTGDAPKPAYEVWRHATDPEARSCGFELDGHTVVRHAVDPTTGAHRYSSRVPAAGTAVQPEAWTLDYAEAPGTALLVECGDGFATWLSRAAHCDGATPMGPVGWIRVAPTDGHTELWGCAEPVPFGVVRTATTATCPPGAAVDLLGYVPGDPPTTTTTSTPASGAAVTPTFAG